MHLLGGTKYGRVRGNAVEGVLVEGQVNRHAYFAQSLRIQQVLVLERIPLERQYVRGRQADESRPLGKQGRHVGAEHLLDTIGQVALAYQNMIDVEDLLLILVGLLVVVVSLAMAVFAWYALHVEVRGDLVAQLVVVVDERHVAVGTKNILDARVVTDAQIPADELARMQVWTDVVVDH